MVPVSYPNRIPPKATKPPTAMAGHDLPTSSGGPLSDSLRRVVAILYVAVGFSPHVRLM